MLDNIELSDIAGDAVIGHCRMQNHSIMESMGCGGFEIC